MNKRHGGRWWQEDQEAQKPSMAMQSSRLAWPTDCLKNKENLR